MTNSLYTGNILLSISSDNVVSFVSLISVLLYLQVSAVKNTRMTHLSGVWIFFRICPWENNEMTYHKLSVLYSLHPAIFFNCFSVKLYLAYEMIIRKRHSINLVIVSCHQRNKCTEIND